MATPGGYPPVTVRDAAIATLRRCAEALCRDVPAEERARLLALHAEALRALERRYRPSTEALIARVARLERLMAHMERGKRAAAICERLGISRAYYYRLRSLQTSVDNAAV